MKKSAEKGLMSTDYLAYLLKKLGLWGGGGAAVGATVGGVRDDMTAGEGAVKGLGIGAGLRGGTELAKQLYYPIGRRIGESVADSVISGDAGVGAALGVGGLNTLTNLGLMGTGAYYGGKGGKYLADKGIDKYSEDRNTNSYEQGFVEKCAEFGVDPNALIKEAGLANLIGTQTMKGKGLLSKNPIPDILNQA